VVAIWSRSRVSIVGVLLNKMRCRTLQRWGRIVSLLYEGQYFSRHCNRGTPRTHHKRQDGSKEKFIRAVATRDWRLSSLHLFTRFQVPSDSTWMISLIYVCVSRPRQSMRRSSIIDQHLDNRVVERKSTTITLCNLTRSPREYVRCVVRSTHRVGE
jgi:hypothetical protein